MQEKTLKFYYLTMTSFKCFALLFKHKRIIRTVFPRFIPKYMELFC